MSSFAVDCPYAANTKANTTSIVIEGRGCMFSSADAAERQNPRSLQHRCSKYCKHSLKKRVENQCRGHTSPVPSTLVHVARRPVLLLQQLLHVSLTSYLLKLYCLLVLLRINKMRMLTVVMPLMFSFRPVGFVPCTASWLARSDCTTRC